MTKEELRLLRKLLFLDVRECAKNIGNVGVRQWQHWESGRNKVPVDVSEKMIELAKLRQQLINKEIDKLGFDDDVSKRIYESVEAENLAQLLQLIKSSCDTSS